MKTAIFTIIMIISFILSGGGGHETTDSVKTESNKNYVMLTSVNYSYDSLVVYDLPMSYPEEYIVVCTDSPRYIHRPDCRYVVDNPYTHMLDMASAQKRGYQNCPGCDPLNRYGFHYINPYEDVTMFVDPRGQSLD